MAEGIAAFLWWVAEVIADFVAAEEAGFAAIYAGVQTAASGAALIGANIALAALAGQPDTQTGNTANNARGQLINMENTQVNLPLIYGQTRVGGNRVARGVGGSFWDWGIEGPGNTGGAVFNSDFSSELVFGEGPVSGIAIDPDRGILSIWLDDLFWDQYGQSLYQNTFHTGSLDQAVDTQLTDVLSDWNEPMRFTSYLHTKIRYYPRYLAGVPNITALINGLLCYDPRDYTIKWTDNPALHVRDYLTRSSNRGGFGIAADRLDDLTFSEAATYCELQGWTCNICLTTNQNAIDNLNKLLVTGRLHLIYSGNKFKLKYRDSIFEAVVMPLTEADVVEEGGQSTLEVIQPSIFDLPNALHTKWIDPTNKYQVADYIMTDPEALASDGDYREQLYDLLGVTNFDNVQRLTACELMVRRINKTATFVGHSRTLSLEQEDLVTLTHRKYGWVDKRFRVTSTKIRPDGKANITMQEDYDSFYTGTYDMSSHSFYDTTLPQSTMIPPPVSNVVAEEEVYEERGRTRTRLNISWDPPIEYPYIWFAGAEVWLSLDDGLTWTYLTKSLSGYTVDPVEEKKRYMVKLISTSTYDTKQLFNEGKSVASYIIGASEDVPASLTALFGLVAGDVVNLFAEEVAGANVDGYETRIGDSWLSGILVRFTKAPKLSLTSVKPGTYTFWMAAKNNAGKYSATKRNCTVTVFYPPGYVSDSTWTWDFSTGDFSNTEQVDQSGIKYLKCSHTADVLTGTWTSPVIDLGSTKTARVWGDFITSVDNSALTWDGLWPSTNTWDSVSLAQTWSQIFAVDVSVQVLATIYWGSTSACSDGSADYFQMSCVEFSARYFKVIVTLIDPTLDTNVYLKTFHGEVAVRV